MPSSYPENITPIVKLIQKLEPKTVLDIGPGWGKYGLMCKEYAGATVDAIEVFEPYIKEHKLRSIYKSVSMSDALRYRPKKEHDLVLIIDVIEHWPKEKAHKLLERLLANGSKVLVVTPRADLPQGAVNGNDWERHVSDWNTPDIEQYEFKDYSNDISFIWLLCA